MPKRSRVLVEFQLLQFQHSVEIDVIEMQDRQDAGIGPTPSSLVA